MYSNVRNFNLSWKCSRHGAVRNKENSFEWIGQDRQTKIKTDSLKKRKTVSQSDIEKVERRKKERKKEKERREKKS